MCCCTGFSCEDTKSCGKSQQTILLYITCTIHSPWAMETHFQNSAADNRIFRIQKYTQLRMRIFILHTVKLIIIQCFGLNMSLFLTNQLPISLIMCQLESWSISKLHKNPQSNKSLALFQPCNKPRGDRKMKYTVNMLLMMSQCSGCAIHLSVSVVPMG